MRRVLLASAAMAVGAGAVIGLAPRTGLPSAVAGNPAAPSTSGAGKPAPSPHHSTKKHHRPSAAPTPTSPRSSAKPASSPPPSPTPSQESTSKTITGPVVSNGWGPVEVRVTVKDGRIASVEVPVTPQDGRSRFINSRAVPILTQEAVQAQSAQVDVVSGATDTSVAFMESLTAALQQAR